MRAILVSGLLSLATSGCNDKTCGTGTIERNGACVPADEVVGTAACGPFTMLVGDQCVPMFPPTQCDPATTIPDVDPTTGVTTCIGTGGGGCAAAFACPAPASGKMTICGQLYDFDDNSPFRDPNATGAKCTTTTTTGPCALGINAFDAVQFAMNPTGTPPLAVGSVFIDDCGRYRVTDIPMPTGPFVGLGIDDANSSDRGPTGVTNAVGLATSFRTQAVKGFEAWIVKPATTAQWTATGGPSLSTGYYVPIYRAHCVDSTGSDPQCTGDPFEPQAGVQFTKGGATEPANTFYFSAAESAHRTIDTNRTMTGANGTALVDNATVNDNAVYSGSGGLTDTVNCKWDAYAGATLPGIVEIQIFRKIDVSGKKCAE